MTPTTSALCAALSLAAVGGLTAFKTPGDKDVNVINTPNVNVVNSPTVTVGNTVAVAVQENREYVRIRIEAVGTTPNSSIPIANRYVVPAGKRLHITHVSGIVTFDSDEDLMIVTAGIVDGFNPLAQVYIPFGDETPTLGPNVGAHTFGSPVDVFANEGEQVGGFWTRTGSSSSVLTLQMTGYLVDMP